MSYGDTFGVSALVQGWDGATNPTQEQVEAWLSEAYAKINRAIGNAGYGTPIDDDAALFPELAGLENLYAAAYTLRARAIDSASGQGEERSELWLKDFYTQLADLVASDLSLAGASLLASSSTTSSRRRRLRTVQMRRVDGYARGPVSNDFTPVQGEYSGVTPPAE